MRRHFIAVAIAALASLLWLLPAWAQPAPYPNRPIHIIVPFPPGGAVDPIARSVGQKLSEAWGQPVVVDNKPGAATIVGSDFVAKAPPDGYTVMLASTSFSVNPAAYSKLPFDPVKDFMPISLVSKMPLLLVVNPQAPVHSVKELIDYLKARPGKVNFSSIGTGSTQHLAGELFKSMTGVNTVHIPYKGSGPSMMSVISGETSLTFETVFLLSPQVKAGKLRAIGAAGLQRAALLPDVPTISESGLSGFDVASWVMLIGPAGMPPEVVQKWQREIGHIMQLPDMRQQQISAGLEPIGSSPDQAAEFLKTEMARWGKIVRQTGITLD